MFACVYCSSTWTAATTTATGTARTATTTPGTAATTTAAQTTSAAASACCAVERWFQVARSQRSHCQAANRQDPEGVEEGAARGRRQEEGFAQRRDRSPHVPINYGSHAQSQWTSTVLFVCLFVWLVYYQSLRNETFFKKTSFFFHLFL